MTTLWGWGAQRRVGCDLRAAESVDQLRRALDPAGTLARGLGRSYGDTALNEGRRVVDLTRFDRYLEFDEAQGLLRCEAGVSLAQIIDDFAPRGFFPLVTPGTKLVTIGGCIANDVHGKAHHAQGSFVSCLRSMRLLLADGRAVECSRVLHPDLFWATVGGIGLTGIVVDATLQLRRIETTYFKQKVLYARDLDEMVALLAEHEGGYPYSVANIDFVASGKDMGRGVLTLGEHARREELPARLAAAPLATGRYPVADVPFDFPTFAFNPFTRRILNQVILAMLRGKGEFEPYNSFFYPLDILSNWNRGYGRPGFIQYQFVIPAAAGVGPLRELLGRIMASGQLPFLNVLKRMGPANEAPLSFPLEGYTFAVDFPVRPGLRELAADLDQRVADAGGRIYLGKDSYLGEALFRRMYPRVDEWIQVKRRWDPDGVFTSDMGRRLGLSR